MPYNLLTLIQLSLSHYHLISGCYTVIVSQEARQKIRQRLHAERGTIIKEAGQTCIRFALAYPNTYFVGMSNLGVQTMYRVLNQRPDTVCERVFLPAAEE